MKKKYETRLRIIDQENFQSKIRSASLSNLFGTIQNKQRAPFLAYIKDLKTKTGWLEGEDILPQIPNYVMNFFLDVPFRLRDIPLHLSNSYLKPDEFAAATVRILYSACLVFENGKLVITGTRSENDVKHAAYLHQKQLSQVCQLVKVLNEDGTPMLASEDELVQPNLDCPIPPFTRPDVKKQVYTMSTMEKQMEFKNFKIVNVVGSGIASIQPISLSLMANIMTTTCCEWDPESFPGLKIILLRKYIPLSVPQITAHSFDSGNAVMMGATCNDDVKNGFIFLKCIMKYFIDHQLLKHKIVNKFQYRISQIAEVKDMINNLDDKDKAELETQILEESSVRCFGNYMFKEMEMDRKNNFMHFMERDEDFTMTESQKLNALKSSVTNTKTHIKVRQIGQNTLKSQKKPGSVFILKRPSETPNNVNENNNERRTHMATTSDNLERPTKKARTLLANDTTDSINLDQNADGINDKIKLFFDSVII